MESADTVPGTRIPAREVVLRFSRSGGPGGQHANVTDSRVEAVLDLRTCAGLSEAQRARLVARYGPVLRVSAQDERSQLRNRELALERLGERVAAGIRVERPRLPTRAPPRARRARLEAKKRRSDVKRTRRQIDDQ